MASDRPSPICGIGPEFPDTRPKPGRTVVLVTGDNFTDDDRFGSGPCVRTAPTRPMHTTHAGDTATRTGRGRLRQRIAVIDDHALFAESIDLALSRSGYDVSIADVPGSPAQTAGLLARTCRAHPAVVLLDLDLGSFGDGVGRLCGSTDVENLLGPGRLELECEVELERAPELDRPAEKTKRRHAVQPVLRASTSSRESVASALRHLGHLKCANGQMSQGFDVFLATGLTPGPTDLEPEEQDLRSRWFPRADVDDMISRGVIVDDCSVAAYTLLLLNGSGAG